MEYIYAALALHSAKQAINEENVTKVLGASGASVDATRVKALVTALTGVNIDEAIKQAAVAPAATAAPAAGEAKKEEKKDEKSDAEKEAEASAGLASLFG